MCEFGTTTRRLLQPRGLAIAILSLVIVVTPPNLAFAQDDREAGLEFDTELIDLTLTDGPVPIPFAADPANVLGDSVEGYGLVNSTFVLTVSSQRPGTPGAASTGRLIAVPTENAFEPRTGFLPIDVDAYHGQTFYVDNVYELVFDLTFTDVDARPGRDYAGQSDGATISLLDIGPLTMRGPYNAVFDKDLPAFGLTRPPEFAHHQGLPLDIEVLLGTDINQNGQNDKLRFEVVVVSFPPAGHTFTVQPDGTVIDGFASGGFVVAHVQDPSASTVFTVGEFDGFPDPLVLNGPSTTSAVLLTGIQNPGFSYVDVNGDHLFDEDDRDVALVAGEVEDGRFSTRKAEGGYSSPVPGAGLVINTAPPADTKKITYECEGDLVVNADLTAAKLVNLRSRGGDVMFDDSTVTAAKVVVKAGQNIVSIDDQLLGAGPRSRVLLTAVGSIHFDGTTVEAGKLVKLRSKNLGPDDVFDCRLAACEKGGRVLVLPPGGLALDGTTIRAYSRIDVRTKHGGLGLAGTDVAIVDGSANGKIRVKGASINLQGATVVAPKPVKLDSTTVLGTPTELGFGTRPCGR